LKKIAIITTHPIQYNSPLFKMLNERRIVQIKVFYSWGEKVLIEKYDPGFGKIINWDVPLLEGYDYHFTRNISKEPGSHHYSGIDNPDLIKEIEDWKPHAIMVFGWSFKSHLIIMRYFKGKIPVFFRGDSTLIDSKDYISKIVRNLILRWVYSNIDVAFFVGTRNREYYEKAGLKSTQLIFAPHAVEFNRFSYDNPECKNESYSIRKNLNIREEEIVFLFAGKLEAKKDPELLLKAFRTCNFSKKIHLLIVGNGILEEKLKQEFNSENNIHFIPFQNQKKMPLIYKAADVFVLPSKGPEETWGLSVNEAMASGLAILVSNRVGCSIDLVENGLNGYEFENGNLQDLAGKLKNMASSKWILKEMGEFSQNKIRDWSFENICTSIENQLLNYKNPV
jgi:glycosyltransferase involved in cell wall biosynthesis